MTKTRAWPVKLMYMLIAAALAISLIVIAAPTQRVSADPGLSKWTKVSTPSQEGVVLAPSSDIVDFAVGATGEVAYAVFQGSVLKNKAAVSDTWLLKSDDGAATWKDLNDALDDVLQQAGQGEEIDELLQVACDADDPDFLAVALVVDGEVRVFISDDGGATFKDTGKVNIPSNMIFAFEVSPAVAGERNIAIGGSNGSKGLIFRSTTQADVATAWIDATTYGTKWSANSAVVDIKFAPSWTADKTILVATATNSAVLLQVGTWGTVKGWNEDSSLAMASLTIASAATVTGLTKIPWATLKAQTATIATPQDYSGRNSANRMLWVSVNYLVGSKAEGRIFRVSNKTVTKVNQQIENLPWLTSVSYLGTISEGKAIAGLLGDGTAGAQEYPASAACCSGVQVYRNDGIANMDICCVPWEEACKPPTGTDAMMAFYVSNTKAYAVALGGSAYDEGAWSVNWMDDGDTWNQLSLIDTDIDYLSDVAVSPDCNKTMLVSANLGSGCGCDSVWLYAGNLPEAQEYSGHWLRTWCGQLGSDQYGLLRLPPASVETTGDTVYLVDRGTDTVYWNELETLACWERGSAATVGSIADLAVKDKETIYAVGENGKVAMSDDYAVGWQKAVDSKVGAGWTIAVHSNNATDVLVGGQDGDVSHSDDGGETFTVLEQTPTIEGYVTIAFDTYFDTNNTIYAAVIQQCPTVTGGIYSWVIGTSDEWKDLGAEHHGYTGLVLSYPGGNPFTSADTGGVLYASYIGKHCASNLTTQCWYTGVARSLTPITEAAVCPTCEQSQWDYLTVGLTANVAKEMFYMMPKALKICGCLTADSKSNLFAIDGAYGTDGPGYDMSEANDGTVWTFEDCYAKKAVEIVSPADGFVVGTTTCECCNAPFNVKWDRLCDACCYEIQFAYDAAFTEPYEPQDINGSNMDEIDFSYYCPGDISAEAAVNPTAFIGCGFQPETTYYWRVRTVQAATGQEIHSWWSDARSFTVAPTAAAGAIDLVAPVPGATDVGIKNIGFSWSTLADVDSYDWKLSASSDLSNALGTATGLTGTATTYTGTPLTYGTTYYWQVKAYKSGSAIATSPIGTFTTTPHGAFCSAIDGACFDTQSALDAHNNDLRKPAGTPFWVWVVIGIGAVLVIVVIVLIFRTRRV